jgi:purine-binding chemotaxis protein CheW
MSTMIRAFESQATCRLTSFYLGDLLIGLPIEVIHEINRCMDVTYVPHAPDWVHGVTNLRGDVVSVIDLRVLLGLSPTEITARTRTLVVEWQSQRMALLVDRIADVLTISPSDILPPPANIQGVDGRMFNGVIPLAEQLVVLLNLGETMKDV